MPNDPSSDQTSSITDIYENDPYRNRRAKYKNSITWKCPSSTTIHSYLPYSDQSSLHMGQHSIPPPLPAPTMITLNDPLRTMSRDIRQDSLLTTITTTTTTVPFLHSGATTLSLSEELRKKHHQQGQTGWWPPYTLQGKRLFWRWILTILCCFLVCTGGILLFICLPRLPLVTMASMADTFGQEPADWGPPLHPFYRTTWQLNLTFNNQPNFIPLHLVQMDLVLSIHHSFWNTSSSLSTSTTTTTPTTDLIGQSEDQVPFAWSTLPEMTLTTGDNEQHQNVNAIFHIDYVASTSNLTDPTFAQLYNACGPKNINNPPTLNVSLQITFHILHYLWLPTLTVYPSEENDGLICPSN